MYSDILKDIMRYLKDKMERGDDEAHEILSLIWASDMEEDLEELEYPHAVKHMERVIREYVELFSEKYGLDEADSKAMQKNLTQSFNRVRDGFGGKLYGFGGKL